MWIEIILLLVLLLGYLQYLENQQDRELKAALTPAIDNLANYHIDNSGFVVTDRDTGHIFLARNHSGMLSSYGILPERNLTQPLTSWRLGENPFPNNNIYFSTFIDEDGSSYVLKVQPDVDFATILRRYENQIQKAL